MIEKRIQLTSLWLVVLLPWIATFGSTEALFDKDGYALPQLGHAFDFPRDHGSHPAFKTEWWYITGHLESKEDDGKYGFQITFFRSATRPQGEEASAAMPEHIYMAHAALLDKKTGAYIHEERFNRSGWNADA
ncbi:MAG: lipocalin-like domain-containing protein, partial [Verrucomicrobiota bacterium]